MREYTPGDIVYYNEERRSVAVLILENNSNNKSLDYKLKVIEENGALEQGLEFRCFQRRKKTFSGGWNLTVIPEYGK